MYKNRNNQSMFSKFEKFKYVFKQGDEVIFESEDYEKVYDKQVKLVGGKSELTYSTVSKTGDIEIRNFGHPDILLYIIKKIK